MARTPYRRTNVALQVPKIDFAASKAVARGAANLGQSLDRMTSQLIDKERIKAKVAGAEFGADKAPTAEQIRAAMDGGESLSLPGNQKGSLFERSAYAQGLKTVSDQITIMARTSLSEALNNAQINDDSPAAFLNEVGEIIKGYGETLDGIDPIYAKQFRAEIATIGNAQYNGYAKTYLANRKIEDKATFASGLNLTFDKVIPKLFDIGVPLGVNADGSPKYNEATKDFLLIYKENTLNHALRAGYTKSEIEGLSLKFDTEINNAAESYISNEIYLAEDKYEIYQNIAKGKSVSPQLQTAVDILKSGKGKLAVITAARNAWMQTVNDDELFAKQIIENDKKILNNMDDQLAKVLVKIASDPAGNLETYLEILDRFESENSRLSFEIQERRTKINQIQTDVGTLLVPENSNVSIISALDMKLSSTEAIGGGVDQLNLRKLNFMYLSGDLSSKDYKDYSNIIRNRMDSNYEDGLKRIRKSFRLPMGMMLNPTTAQNKRFNRMQEFELLLDAAKRKNPLDFDVDVWLDENLTPFIENDNNQKLAKYNRLLLANDKTRNQLLEELNGLQDSRIDNIRRKKINDILEAAAYAEENDGIVLKDNWSD
tara:strand:+ start:69 stop:1871 length:1803 start_codon:yes stop_codon:yes gene_type:complete